MTHFKYTFIFPEVKYPFKSHVTPSMLFQTSMEDNNFFIEHSSHYFERKILQNVILKKKTGLELEQNDERRQVKKIVCINLKLTTNQDQLYFVRFDNL